MNNGQFMWGPMHHRWVILKMINVSHKSCWENRNAHFMFNIFSPRKSCCLWDNVEKYDRAGEATDDNTWMTYATNTHSEYVTLIAFLLQHWLCERASVLRCTCVACLISFFRNSGLKIKKIKSYLIKWKIVSRLSPRGVYRCGQELFSLEQYDPCRRPSSAYPLYGLSRHLTPRPPRPAPISYWFTFNACTSRYKYYTSHLPMTGVPYER
jgi:hypothetical protein